MMQMKGSVWPKVLPYCIFNLLVMAGISYIDRNQKFHSSFEISPQGHGFAALVVAFLLVTRVNIALMRFGEGRNNIGIMYKATRELIQDACVLSNHHMTEQAKAWRHELAYRALILLRTSMVVIDYPTNFVAAWDIPELQGDERELVRTLLTTPLATRWAHSERGEWENTMRVPIKIAYLLRQTVHSQSRRIRPPIHVNFEAKLLGTVDTFMTGYYGIRKFLTTPVPFPLIQMARTFLFVYIFTVPFVLLADRTSGVVADCITVFLITFGFLGLELVAIELDNPFGDDDNDFDNAAMALSAYEDTYLTLYDLDGEEWVDELRRKMGGTAPVSATVPDAENSWLLENVV